MLKSLKLNSFKGFREFELPLEPVTCLVGLNSKGKTSVLQAIHLLHDITDFAFGRKGQRGFANVKWQSNPTDSLARLSFDDPSSVWLHRKTTEPCKLSVLTDDEMRVCVEIRGPREYGLSIDIDGTSAKDAISDSEVQKKITDFLELSPTLLPPVGSVSPSEPYQPYPEMWQRVEQGRLSECWRSYLWWLYNDGQKQEFDGVVGLLKEHFPTTTLQPPSHTHDNPARILIRFLEEHTALDISHSGSGMRTLLNLATVLKFADSRCFLFDEPDAHLHPTLQRKAARMLHDFAEEEGKQVIIATHAAEFIAEMPASTLVWIDREKAEASRVSKLGEVLVDLGALTSADAVRAYGANKVLFVEGNLDPGALSQLLGPYADPNPFADPRRVLVARLPNGKGDTRHLRLFKELLHETFLHRVRIAAIVDNDFDVTPRFSDGDVTNELEVFALPRKEIENFFIEPSVFARALAMAAAKRGERTGTTDGVGGEEDVRSKLREILDSNEVRNTVYCQVAPRYEDELERNEDRSTKRAKSEAWFEKKWSDEDWCIRRCPGKMVLGRLRKWAQETYKVTVTSSSLREACGGFEGELKKFAERVSSFLYRDEAK